VARVACSVATAALAEPLADGVAIAVRPDLAARHFTPGGKSPYDTVTWERRDVRIVGSDGAVVFEQAGVEVPSEWSANATSVLAKLYLRGRESGLRQMVERVVGTIAAWGVEDGYLEIACIGTGNRFESPEPAQRREQVDRVKRFVELAADVGCTRVRVFGNDMPQGVERDRVVGYVAESLRELGEHAEGHGVDVLLEMHGQFNYWGFARTAVELASHPRIGLVYNCDRRDLVAGSVAATYSQVRRLIRHVHLHGFTGSYPYPELFALLQRDGYDGYLSSEIEGTDGPTREQLFAMYAALFRAWAGQPFFPMPD